MTSKKHFRFKIVWSYSTELHWRITKVHKGIGFSLSILWLLHVFYGAPFSIGIWIRFKIVWSYPTEFHWGVTKVQKGIGFLWAFLTPSCFYDTTFRVITWKHPFYLFNIFLRVRPCLFVYFRKIFKSHTIMTKKIVLQLLTVVFVFSFSAETLAQSKKKKKDDKEAVVNSATKPSFE